MKLCVLQWGRTGGGPRFAYELTRALAGAGKDVVVSYSAEAEIAPEFERLGVATLAVHTFQSGKGSIFRAPILARHAVALHRFLGREAVDVVVVAMEQIWQAPVSWVFRLGGRKTLLVVHDASMHPGDSNRIEATLRALERRSADGALVLSEHVYNELRFQEVFPANRTWRSVHATYPISDVPRVRSLPVGRKPVVGFFGRLSKYKGLAMGYDAITLSRLDGLDILFRVVGSGDRGDVDQLTHADDDVRVGWVAEEDVESVVRGFDVVLLPYLEASQSGVLAYSTALGIPAVVTPVGGLVEQSQLYGSAVVAGGCDATSLSTALTELLADPSRYEALSSAALKSSAFQASWRRVADDVFRAATEIILT